MRSLRPLAWLAVLAVVATITYQIAQKRDYIRDFGVYRTAAVRVLHGEPLYRADDGEYQYKYWPAFAFAMLPFALVPAEAGKLAWFVISIGLFGALVRLAITELPGRRTSFAWLTMWMIVLDGKHIVREVVNGQTNTLLAWLILTAAVTGHQRRPILTGVLVGVAVFVKPYALLIVLWVVATQGLAGMTAAGAVMAAGLMLPAAVYGWQGNLGLLGGWYATVTATTPGTLAVRENISFASLWARWIHTGSEAMVLTVISVLAMLVLAALVWLGRRRVAYPEYLEVSLLLLLVPLISPQGWDYVLLIATPAFALLVDRFAVSKPPWKLATTAGFSLTSFVIYDLVGRAAYFELTGVLAVGTIGTVLLAASVAHLRFRSMA